MPVKTYLRRCDRVRTVLAADASGLQVGGTYSTVLLQAGGLLIVMNTQLDRMVTMMNRLNNLIRH